tara:strand:+ start:828 stop:1799 length:972 start_codon:yes stop_codon:yes gene_type:complete
MIWFFGTSHTDGFADGEKFANSLTFSDITAAELDMNYINFGTSGSDNTQMLNCMKAAINDTTIPRPDTIIIEPRNRYDYKIFPKLYKFSDSINKNFRWRNKNDAVYIGFWNDYVRLYDPWMTLAESGVDPSSSGFLKKLKAAFLKEFPVAKDGYIRHFVELEEDELYDEINSVAGDIIVKWRPRNKLDEYDEWWGKWYESMLSQMSETYRQNHNILHVKLEQEISALLLLATSITDNVGCMVWDMHPTHWCKFRSGTQHLNKYMIFNETVHTVLEQNHYEDYIISTHEYMDDHLGPTAHQILAPYIIKWIKNRKNYQGILNLR